MPRIIFITILSVGLILGTLPFSASPVHAEDLSAEQVAKVKANCVSIKNSINQLHASDALLRVNRGQVYEAMGTKLMDTFNGRLESNKLDNAAMVTVTGRYRTALDTFRTDYIAYEQKLSDTLHTDCTSQPAVFHDKLQQARALRTTVHDDIVKLHRLIDDYRLTVDDFLLNYERISQ